LPITMFTPCGVGSGGSGTGSPDPPAPPTPFSTATPHPQSRRMAESPKTVAMAFMNVFRTSILAFLDRCGELVRHQNEQFPGSATSIRRSPADDDPSACAGMSWTARVCASTMPSFRMMCTWPAPGSTSPIPVVYTWGRAMGIVTVIGCHCSRRDDDQAMARVRVPAGASARLPDVALYVQV
jgi:hypothetical protein